MTLEQVLQQGGLVAVCGMLIWLLREQGRRIAENNETWLELGRVVERLTGSVDRIELGLRESTVCPVTQITTEALRGHLTREGVPHRRRMDTVVREAFAERLGDEPREGR